MERVNAWTTYKKREEKKVMDFGKAYRAYLDSSKTERECARETIRRAEKAGYVDLEKAQALKPGDRVYVNTMNKAVQLFIIGTEPLEKGLNIMTPPTVSGRVQRCVCTLLPSSARRFWR